MILRGVKKVGRLCIYLIYDSDKIVDGYIGTALKELKRFSDMLVVVCNFDHIEKGLDNITEYADMVYCRENKGYDAGGYQDGLCRLVTWGKVYEYDELLLTNDTWFGPVYPFDDMFNKMKNVECDFWGVTRYIGGGDEGGFPSHIQSYFIDFRFELLHSKCFRQFWEDYGCSDDKNETVRRFEIGISQYLNNNGFVGKAYMDLFRLPYAGECDTNFYISYAYELMRDIRMPMMKRIPLNFDIRRSGDVLKAIEYIKESTEYDYALIENHIKRKKYVYGNNTGFDFELMEGFIMRHKRIFFYGYGRWAHNLATYFTYRGWHFDGYIVSENCNGDTEALYVFSEMKLQPGDGIIIALKDKSACEGILNNISKSVALDNVLTPVYE
jgi:rhamnosyltransferase